MVNPGVALASGLLALGILSSVQVVAPTPAVAAPAASQVSAGGQHTCAIISGGAVRCWGDNSAGQLGDGTTTSRKKPAKVKGLSQVRAITTGVAHSCALLNDRSVSCWGGNYLGQLGDGTNRNRKVPTPVPSINSVISLAAGGEHTCALVTGGRVTCWGADGRAGPGVGNSSPSPVEGLADASGISAGGSGWGVTCASVVGGTSCWGDNLAYLLGDGTRVSRPEPKQSESLSALSGLAIGAFTSCGLNPSGAVECLGLDILESIRVGWLAILSGQPTAIPGVTNASQVDVGGGTACALNATGSVLCWGGGASGEIGNGKNEVALTATAVSRLAPVKSISVGGSHACALGKDGTVRCWGYNRSGQLGDGTTVNRNTPVSVAMPR